MRKQQWRTGVAILTAFSLSTGTIAQLVGVQTAATAGTVSQRGTRSGFRVAQYLSGRIDRGTVLDVREQNGKKIIVAPDDTARVTLVTTRSIRSQTGSGSIPRGTKIEGDFRPAGDGTQFVARRIIYPDGTSQNIDATSNILNYRTTIQKGSSDAIWQGALVGGGASVLISSIVTRPGIAKTLAGAGAGALAGYLLGGGRSKSADVIVIRPNDPLTLTLNSDLVFNNRY